MRVDLHTHTTASDGELTPLQLLEFQARSGVELLAITDHDTLAGWSALQSALPAANAPRLIPGIEFSASDGKNEIHIVGLHFDPAHMGIHDAIREQHVRRRERAVRIDERLQRLGIPGALERVQNYAGDAAPGRVHFARFLVEAGRVRDFDSAFRRYLGSGKPAAVAFDWPTIEQTVACIRGAGGRAVLAHPHAYPLGRAQLRALVQRFTDCGGEAMEVALPNVNSEQLRRSAELIRHYGLLASAGSDFHASAQVWRVPARIPELPLGMRPVWHDWI
jgi:3',5'-nucleoside bisphosphate phosphatase